MEHRFLMLGAELRKEDLVLRLDSDWRGDSNDVVLELRLVGCPESTMLSERLQRYVGKHCDFYEDDVANHVAIIVDGEEDLEIEYASRSDTLVPIETGDLWCRLTALRNGLDYWHEQYRRLYNEYRSLKEALSNEINQETARATRKREFYGVRHPERAKEMQGRIHAYSRIQIILESARFQKPVLHCVPAGL